MARDHGQWRASRQPAFRIPTLPSHGRDSGAKACTERRQFQEAIPACFLQRPIQRHRCGVELVSDGVVGHQGVVELGRQGQRAEFLAERASLFDPGSARAPQEVVKGQLVQDLQPDEW